MDFDMKTEFDLHLNTYYERSCQWWRKTLASARYKEISFQITTIYKVKTVMTRLDDSIAILELSIDYFDDAGVSKDKVINQLITMPTNVIVKKES